MNREQLREHYESQYQLYLEHQKLDEAIGSVKRLLFKNRPELLGFLRQAARGDTARERNKRLVQQIGRLEGIQDLTPEEEQALRRLRSLAQELENPSSPKSKHFVEKWFQGLLNLPE
jgi:hypothetical protein